MRTAGKDGLLSVIVLPITSCVPRVYTLTFVILEVGEWIIILLFLVIIFLEASESFRQKRKRT
ncbi:hypothetical protein DT075_34070 [Bacillus licheniformis]|nr:hypothetical protein DT075_34070 [Bacillus licheniformis]